jgi:hypothetical protein
LAPSPLRLTAKFFSQLNTCGHSPYITSSLTREWVCNLQLLLALASAFILGSESCETRDYVFLHLKIFMGAGGSTTRTRSKKPLTRGLHLRRHHSTMQGNKNWCPTTTSASTMVEVM